MLKKLLKYEFKVTGRTFLPFYIVMLAVAVVNRLVQFLQPDYNTMPLNSTFRDVAVLLQIIVMTMFVCIIIGVFILTFYIVVQRFYKNLLTDEGYLMFTLPVKPYGHIVSKLLAAMVWLFVSSIVAFLAIVIVSGDAYFIQEITSGLSELMIELGEVFGIGFPFLVFEGLLTVLVTTAASILQIYVAICIGQLFNRHKIIGAFAAYFGINLALQLLSIPLILVLNLGFVQSLMYDMNPAQVAHTIMGFGLVISLLQGVLYFYFSNSILQKHLNLE